MNFTGSTHSSTLVFIDSNVTDINHLLTGLASNTEVITLDTTQDGIEQITQALSERKNIDSIQIVSHGADGQLQLGATTLTSETLNTYTQQLSQWGQALNPDGNILFLGCNVAASDTGKAFVQQLSQITGANIAASDDLTGNANLGGDWLLEYATGFIEAPLAFQIAAMEAYEGVLADFSASTANQLKEAITEANNNSYADTITITGNISGFGESFGIDLQDGKALSIIGNGGTIDGGNNAQLFNIVSGKVVLSNLTLQNGLAKGGDGAGGGGGGLGAGGALFVSGGNVTVENVTFNNNQARGGNSPNGAGQGGADEESGAAGGNAGGFNGGLDTTGEFAIAVGGGGGGMETDGAAGGNGNFGGGGGGAGGGGGGDTNGNDEAGNGGNGGSGGFGGGGGGGGGGGDDYDTFGSDEDGAGGGGGQGGVFGGNGAAGAGGGGGGGQGGGGAGLGGAIFANEGASLSLINATFNNNGAEGGTGANNGQGQGGAIFARTGAVVNTVNVNYSGNLASSGSNNGYGDIGNLTLPTLSVSNLTNPAESNTNGAFQLTLDQAFSNDITVNYNIAGTATKDTDYTIPQTIVIPAGKTVAEIPVTVKDDIGFDPNETVILTLAAGSPNFYTIGAANSATLTLNDNEPEVSITAGTTPTEANEVSGTFNINLTQPAPEGGLEIQYTVAGTAGQDDYIATLNGNVIPSNSLIIPAGATTTSTNIKPVDDSLIEGQETLKFTLIEPANLEGYAVKDDQTEATLSITDNDTAGVSITPTETTATEGGANGTYSAVLKSQPIAPVTITLTTGNQIGELAPITFTANNWNVAQTVTVQAVDDTVVEGAHSGNITHSVSSTDSKYNALVVPGVTVAITDNDVAPTPTPTPTPITPTPTPTPIPPTPGDTIDTNNWCGVEAGLDKLEKILDDQLQAVNLPIVGPLKNISPDFIGKIKTKVVDTIKNLGNQTLTQLETSLRTALGPDFNVTLTGKSSAAESTLLITLGRQYEFPDINLSTNLGVPALSLDVDGKAKSKYNYNLSLGVGVSKDFGCYIDTDQTKLTANIDLGLDDQFKAKGNLGFFQVDLANDTNNPTKVDASLEVKLNDLDNLGGANDGARLTLPELQGNYQFKDLFNANLTSNANLGLTAKTSINGNPAFPSYNFDLGVNWPILNYANGQLTGQQKPTVAFNNMQLDLGTFVNNFAKPIIGKITDVIQPFRPVINFLNTDTKLLSKLGLEGPFDKNGDGQVSVLELAAKISDRDIDTRFLDAVAKVDKVVDLANQIGNSPDKIDLGSYTLEDIDVADQSANLQNASPVAKTAVEQTANQQINSKTSGKVKEFLNALQDLDGFDVPILAKPQTAIQLLLGKPDVPILSYQMPKLGFDFNIEQKFPIWGPFKGLLEGNFSASANLGFGYDSYGLSEWKKSNFAGGSADKLLDGFYVSDRENADGTGLDVDELSLDARIKAGFGVDVIVADAYLTGGIEGKVGIDLIDIGEFQPKQGGDGKIRVSEITSRISKPSELFDVTGQVNAFLNAQVKALTWKVWKGKQIVYDKNLATFELANFSLGPSSSTRGRAINGYITGGTVFFDANFNGVKDDREPFSITNADGSFDLDVSLDQFDKNNSGDLEAEEGRIAIIDGINTSTYLPQQTPLFATPDAIVVTPLTTLMTELVEQGTDPNQAQIQVKSALGLSSAIDLTSYDPLEAITQNDPNGLAVYAAHAQVQNTIVSIADLISGASNTAKNEIAARVISAVANQIKSGTLDLSNSTQVQAIIQSATSQLQVPQVSSIASDAASIIAEGNQRIKAIASSNSSPSDAATEIARTQKVAQGEVAQDLLQVAAGNKTIQSAISENTGASLNTQILSATANNPTVRNTLNTDGSSTPSTSEEPFPSSGIEFVKDGANTTESTDGDDTITGSASDDVLRGKKGNDLLFTLDGNDWMNGNQGNDLTDGGIGDDTVYGGKGFDTLSGGAGSDFIFGNRGEDLLIGEKGDDTLYGGQGNDILLGGQGNDFLSGDLGNDTLVGDVGSDRFLLSTNFGIDTIDDFEVGQDLLVLGNGLIFSQLTIAEDSGATLIRFAQTGEILASLTGVSASSISAANFGLI